ncbi:hypothetical protein M422DRAFT_275309 [Sphaerobolus stellatus SS14]|uniref:Unplaced genomic scaffold SPHSTscaffold_472, whole genome shotgun sequence n=1 Tax=Sphaerobolus stellatus (strain SS14) TaxID=990650 RepID=A0A0C9UEX7_SPHS4|nr:hypothetical protein M422DRAFT_275309 [Sphaerobolus stellatus SS14]
MKQSALSPGQMWWMSMLNEFDFEIKHIPGKHNTVADVLSHIYSNEQPGTVRTESEYVSEAVKEDEGWGFNLPQGEEITEAIYMGQMIEAEYNLTLNAMQGKETRRNQLPDMSRLESLVFTPAGSLVETITDLERKTWKGKKGRTKAVQGEAQSRVESNINKRLSGGEADRNPQTQDQGIITAFNTIIEVQIPQCLKEQYHSDEFFSKVIKDIGNYKNFEWEAGLLSLKTGGKVLLCIPDNKIGGRKGHTKQPHISDNRYGGHRWFKISKTIAPHAQSVQGPRVAIRSQLEYYANPQYLHDLGRQWELIL